jgi:hypothetical protein
MSGIGGKIGIWNRRISPWVLFWPTDNYQWAKIRPIFPLIIISGNIKDEMRVDVLKWHIDCVRRLGKGRGGRSLLVILTSFTKKLEVLPVTRILVWTNITIKQN